MCRWTVLNVPFATCQTHVLGGSISISEHKSARRLTLNLALSNPFQDKLRSP
jgi:hypothetical protein